MSHSSAGGIATMRGAGALRPVAGVVSLREAVSPAGMVRGVWGLRGLIWQFGVRGVLERHKGSALGLVWTLLQPLLMLAVYTFVFAVVWQAKWGGAEGDKSAFAVTLFAGLALFEVFSASVSGATGVIVQNPNYVKKVVFPLEVLPLSGVVGAALLACVSVVVLLIGKVATGGGVSRTLYLFPLVVPALLMLSAGTAMFLASLSVFLRDIRPLVQGLLLQVVFFMTPIFYPVERVPGWIRGVLAWNPLAVIVESGRRTLVFGEEPAWGALGVVTLVGFLVMLGGYGFFMKSKRGFADVL